MANPPLIASYKDKKTEELVKKLNETKKESQHIKKDTGQKEEKRRTMGTESSTIFGARRIIGTTLIILSALYTLYLIIIMIYKTHVIVEKSSYMTVFAFEMVICAFMLIGAFDVRFGFLTAMKQKWLRMVGWGVRALICVIVAFVLILFVAVVVNSFIRNDEPVKNVIVLGMALEDGKPNKDLINRVDTAYRYAEKNPEATLIVTGGNKGENGKTEADVMR